MVVICLMAIEVAGTHFLRPDPTEMNSLTDVDIPRTLAQLREMGRPSMTRLGQ